MSSSNSWPATYTKLPPIKYTPSSISTTEPWPVAPEEAVVAVLLPPDPPVTVSPFAKACVVLLVPALLYTTYNVSGSEPL